MTKKEAYAVAETLGFKRAFQLRHVKPHIKGFKVFRGKRFSTGVPISNFYEVIL